MDHRDLTNLIKRLTQIQSCIKVADIETLPGFNGILTELFKVCCLPNVNNDHQMVWLQHLKIRKIIEKAEFEQPLGKTISQRFSDFDRETKIKNCIAWVKSDASANIDLLEVVDGSSCETDYQFGLKLKEPVRLGHTVAKIPATKIFDADRLLEQKSLAALVENDPILSNMPNVLLAVGLLIQVYKNDSKWSAYFESFPATYSNCCYFTTENMATLANSVFFMDALNQWKSVVRQYAYIHLKFLEFKNCPQLDWIKEMNLDKRFCLDDYRWAVATIMTRANSIPSPINKDRQTLALIPILDMCNHQETLVSIDYDISENKAIVLAPSNLLADQELMIFYGARPTAFYLIHNGFFLDRNNHDYILFHNKHHINKQGIYSNRGNLLEKLGLIDLFTFPLTDRITAWLGDLRTLYRILYCTDEEYNSLLKIQDIAQLRTKLLDDTVISEQSEKLALQSFIDHLKQILQNYEKPLPSLSHTSASSNSSPHNQDQSDTTTESSANSPNSSSSASLNVTAKKINVWCQLLVSREREMLLRIISQLNISPAL